MKPKSKKRKGICDVCDQFKWLRYHRLNGKMGWVCLWCWLALQEGDRAEPPRYH